MKRVYKYITFIFILSLLMIACFNLFKIQAASTVTLNEGVAVRTNGDNGLMFEGSVSSAVNNAEYGMVFIRGTNKDFDVNSNGAFTAAVDEVDENNKYRVTMVKFPDSAFAQNISVKAFIKVGDSYTYSSNVITCNLYEKAVMYKESNDYNGEALIDYIVDNTTVSFIAYTGSNTTLHSLMANDFMKDFNEYAGTSISVKDFFGLTYGKLDASSAKYVEFFTTAIYAKKWNWVYKYINEVRVDNGKTVLDENSAYALFRGEIHCFLNLCNAIDLGESYKGYGTDYAGRNDYRYYLSGKAPYSLPKLTLNNYIYDGWYLDQSFTSNKINVVTSNSPVYCNFVEPSGDYVEVNLELNGGYITSSGVTATPYKTTIITKYGAGYSGKATEQYISPIVNGKIDGANSGKWQDKITLQYDSKYDAYKILAIYPNGSDADFTNATHVLAKTDLVSDSSLIGKYIITSEKLATEGDVNITLNVHNETDFNTYSKKLLGVTVLPTPYKENYTFIGWYDNPTFTGNKVDSYPGYVLSGDSVTYYAKWLSSGSDLDEAIDAALGSISSNPNSNTIDELTSECNGYNISYVSNHPAYVINKNGTATVSMVNQTHKKINASVTITLNNGVDEIVKEKEIIIDPVLFDELPDTPIAAYFATSSAYAYEKNNSRYLSEKTYFSEDTKETLSMVYYAFLEPVYTGSYNSEGIANNDFAVDGSVEFSSSKYIQNVISLKDNNVRVLLSINGATTGEQIAMYKITRDDALLEAFINNICDIVEQYNFDGVDIDWEQHSKYPIQKTYYSKLVVGLYNELASRQDAGGTKYMLTAAIPGTSWGTSTDRFDYDVLKTYLDYINVMSYDLQGDSLTSHVSPLYSPTSTSNGKYDSYGFSIEYAVNRFTSLGFPASKLILGCAGYGKHFTITGTIDSSAKYVGLGLTAKLSNAGVSGAYNSGTIFSYGIDTLIAQGGYEEVHVYTDSGKFIGSYLINKSKKSYVTYDSTLAITKKYEYATATNGLGLMVWSYTENTNDSFVDSITAIIKNK